MVTKEWFLERVMPEPNTGCWIWTGHTRNNYGLYSHNGKTISAHRTSFILFKSDFDRSLDVCHSCDNPWCVNPDHLFLGTHKQNMDDRDKKGRVSSGFRHYKSTFTPAQISAIKDAHEMGFSNASIGRYFNRHRTTIWDIVNNQTWKRI